MIGRSVHAPWDLIYRANYRFFFFFFAKITFQ